MTQKSWLALVLVALPLSPTWAQTGPWTDGELIIRTTTLPLGQQVLYRVNPANGDGEVLIVGFNYGGWAGGMAFDSYRGGLLANLALPPNTFLYKLQLVGSDGTATEVPGFTGVELRAITPVGDGRVYYQRHGASNPTNEIQYLDAANVIHTLMDQTGAAPFSFSVEHMLYDAPTSSLIATTSAAWSTNNCVPSGGSVFRIPLSADGSQVSGPVICNSYAGGYESFVGLDHLPGGQVLITLNTAYYWPDKLITVDPVTLAIAAWASPGPTDLDGGCFSSGINKAVVFDGTAGLLRTYGPGGTGLGSVLAIDVTVPGSGGYSPVERMCEVDVNGPACIGTALTYGAGLSGTGGAVPTLGVIGCPDVGSLFTVAINGAVGAAPGALVVGFTPAAIPAAGGTLLVFPLDLLLPIAVGGTPSVAGAGSLALPILFSDPAFAGVQFYLQAGFVDMGAIQGLSLTNGLLIAVG